ncbi:hypothetical protein JEM67_00045 (plasmid) [Serratia sp. PAMC26656]|uniref:hypothetical protein n=1 Tax=Serratia sp. PAMC26656 TaxID=2775909 RepID=UPI0018F3597C|nr:hypothetical protein [Serratia sp. PAMC26656]MBJ7889492.1 hypothetical protein [Serratia sp. PAMC26656]
MTDKTENTTSALSHLAFCALAALGVARQDGIASTPYAENLFLIRWLATAQKQNNNGQAMLEAAIAGCGVTQLPDWLCGDAIKKGQLRAILPTFQAPPPHFCNVAQDSHGPS